MRLYTRDSTYEDVQVKVLKFADYGKIISSICYGDESKTRNLEAGGVPDQLGACTSLRNVLKIADYTRAIGFIHCSSKWWTRSKSDLAFS